MVMIWLAIANVGGGVRRCSSLGGGSVALPGVGIRGMLAKRA